MSSDQIPPEIKEALKIDKTGEEKRNTFIAGITFVLISTLAIPIWLKTTEVKRALVPFQVIDDLLGNRESNTRLTLTLKIPICVTFERTTNASTWSPAEKKAMLQWTQYELLSTLNATNNGLDYNILAYYGINSTDEENTSGNGYYLEGLVKIAFTKMEERAGNEKILLKRDQIIVPFTNDLIDSSKEAMGTNIKYILDDVVGIETISRHLRRAFGVPRIPGVGTVDYVAYLRNNLAKLSTDRFINIDFIILQDRWFESTDFERIDHAFIEELKESMRPLAPLHYFKYRIRHLNTIALPPQWRVHLKEFSDIHVANPNSHEINQLSSFLNVIDSISDVETGRPYGSTSIKFLLCFQPHDSLTSRPISSFSSPGWGSVLLLNQNLYYDNNNRTALISNILLHAFTFMDFPLHRLDYELLVHDPQAYVINLPSLEPWRLDYMARAACIKNLIFAARVIRNFADHVRSTPNLIVDDTVVNEIKRSLDLINRALDSLNGGHLGTALQLSYQAVRLSNEAYFDPSLLESLYFPADQKYAIYIPLFLPIGMGVLTYILALVKSLRRKNSGEKLKTS